jgi:hypothetical protein
VLPPLVPLPLVPLAPAEVLPALEPVLDAPLELEAELPAVVEPPPELPALEADPAPFEVPVPVTRVLEPSLHAASPQRSATVAMVAFFFMALTPWSTTLPDSRLVTQMPPLRP